MKRHGVKLNVPKWESTRVSVMTNITRARAEVDPRFKELLMKFAGDGVRLRHFERRGMFWGGRASKKSGEWLGENVLGKIYEAIGHEAIRHAALAFELQVNIGVDPGGIVDRDYECHSCGMKGDHYRSCCPTLPKNRGGENRGTSPHTSHPHSLQKMNTRGDQHKVLL